MTTKKTSTAKPKTSKPKPATEGAKKPAPSRAKPKPKATAIPTPEHTDMEIAQALLNSVFLQRQRVDISVFTCARYPDGTMAVLDQYYRKYIFSKEQVENVVILP